MTHLLIPMAGDGVRFKNAGYRLPKPVLPIGSWRMFEIVVANLWDESVTSLTLAVKKSFASNIKVSFLEDKLQVPCNIVEFEQTTDGPARTVAVAAKSAGLDCNVPLVVANSDQYIDAGLSPFYETLRQGKNVILGMQADGPKWSYVAIDSLSRVLMVREKEAITTNATCGIYGFSSLGLFLEAFAKMEAENDRTNGEFYVAPAYNYIASESETIYLDLGPVSTVMHGLGTPDDFEEFNISKVRASAQVLADKVFS